MADQVDGERPVTVVAVPEAVTPVVPPSPMTPPPAAVARPASERSRLRRPDSVSKWGRCIGPRRVHTDHTCQCPLQDNGRFRRLLCITVT